MAKRPLHIQRHLITGLLTAFGNNVADNPEVSDQTKLPHASCWAGA